MLKQRIMSGLLFAAVVPAIACGAPPLVILLFIWAFVGLGQLEFYAMLRGGGFPVYRWMGLVFGLTMVTVTFWAVGPGGERALTTLRAETTVWVVAVLAIIIRSLWQSSDSKPVEAVAGTLLGLLYVPFLFNFMTRLAFTWGPANEVSRAGTTGVLLCLYLLLVVKFSDIGAYFSGMKFGKHKMFPRVSPKKSWEGAIGGVLTSLAVSLIFWKLAWSGDFGNGVQLKIWDAIALGLLLPVVGMVGDLCESQMKRACDVKDSGTLIPGMGGVLDVIDSLLFGIPVLYIYVVWLVV